MTRELLPPVDYAAAGLRVGLEVHQQLATGRKMFCNCPVGLYTEAHDAAVLRHMRPTLSELGEYDGTALMEFKTRKNIVYLLNRANVCTYEMDDTPPFLVNADAIDIAIEQSLMLRCDIVDEVHIARKQYLDGSIPTGFQRTAIVGVGGRLPFRGREISVTQVSVEEDSCREVTDQGHLVVWRADRLGMPLIETVTGPDLTTPDEVEEAILLIGRVCRSTGRVRVGIGASRQDVNVSVAGGRRVEIKGVPQAWRARLLVHGEAIRQLQLLALARELARRGFHRAADVAAEHRDVTRLVAGSALPLFAPERWEGFLAAAGSRPEFARGAGPFCVRAVRLPGWAGLLCWATQPGLTFADELKGRVRVVATLDQPPILFHGEDWPSYRGAGEELARLGRAAGRGSDDALVVLWGAEADTVTAAEEIRLRCVDAIDGVPHETRQALAGGRTDFERILPGPDRMYPDTDSPPRALARERVEALRLALPEPPWEREARWTAAGVPLPTIHYLIRRGGARLVDQVVSGAQAEPKRACFFFGEELKGMRRRGVPVDRIAPEAWVELFRRAAERPALWEARAALVVELAADDGAGGAPDLAVALVRQGLGPPSLAAGAGVPADWRSWLAAEARRLPAGLAPPAAIHLLMGRAMGAVRGHVLAAEVAAAARSLLAAVTAAAPVAVVAGGSGAGR